MIRIQVLILLVFYILLFAESLICFKQKRPSLIYYFFFIQVYGRCRVIFVLIERLVNTLMLFCFLQNW